MTAEPEPDSDEVAFTGDERALLDAWQVPNAPRDLGDRILAQADRQARRRTATRWMLAAAVVLGVGGATLVALGRGDGDHGIAHAAQRETVAIGARGVAVLEPGTDLGWAVDGDGDAVLEQSSGSAFYRVERGGAFVVKVPGGQVRVRGTCFRVEVVAMKSGVDAVKGAAVGALATALVLVTVYEGKVEAVGSDEVRDVLPGQRATIRAGTAPFVEDANAPRPETASASLRPGASGAEVVGTSNAPRASGSAPDAMGTPTAPACDADLANARGEAEALKAKVRALEAGAREADALREAHKSYDISQAELERMAERCELRWDTIPYRLGDPPTVPDADAEAFGLSAAQVDSLNKLLAAENARLIAAIRETYVDVTGDDASAITAIAPTALFDEIDDKTPLDEKRRIFQMLAAERAGQAHAPTDPTALARLSPTERLWRLVTTAGDHLESKLADLFGAENARKMRDAHHGFGSVSRSSHGCPPNAPE